MNTKAGLFLTTVAIGLAAASSSCATEPADADGNETETEGEPLHVCDPANGPFTIEGTNPYVPLTPGSTHVLEGYEGGEPPTVRIEYEVLEDTLEIAGVTTRAVRSAAYEDGELEDIDTDYLAEAPDGTICWFGAHEEVYEGEATVQEIVDWRHGEDGAIASVRMPGNPEVGMTYTPAHIPDEGDVGEQAEITHVGEPEDTPAGTIPDTVTVYIDVGPAIEKYGAGIGLIYDDGIPLVEY